MSSGTAGSVHLLGARLNLAHVWEASRSDLVRVLGNADSKKVIVWDEPLIGQVGLIAEVQFLRKHGVTKMVRLPAHDLTKTYPEATEFLFFTRPLIRIVDLIIESLRTSSKGVGKFRVIFVPIKSLHCVKRFEEFGFKDESKGPINFSIDEFHLEMLPMDQDLISLDMNTAFTDLMIESDPTPNFRVAKAICMLQTLFGIIPKIYGKGKNAKSVADMMEKMRRDMFSMSTAKELSSQIDAVVFLDRSVDLLTPLSTQLTYEGLIDEIYGIKHGCAKFPRQLFSEDLQAVPKGAPPPKGPITFLLNSEETMYAELRDLNFSSVGQYLSKEAKKITEAFKERHGAKTVSQLKQFVQKLPHMQQAKQSLSKHTTIAELIKGITDRENFLEMVYTEQHLREEDSPDKAHDYIEAAIGKSEPIVKVLRLICMHSVANSGLKPRLLDYYKKAILNCYGFEHLITLQRLETAGLLRVQDGKAFPTLRKSLRLVADRADEQNISFVFSGYAPLSVRLLELLDRPNGWVQFEEFSRLLPGPSFARTQPVPRGQEKKKRPSADRPQVVLVCFLGGCSYAEIAALRFLSQREDATTDYIVCTTNLINGVGLINSILAETPNFHPEKLWDNQLDDPASSSPSQSQAKPPGPPRRTQANFF